MVSRPTDIEPHAEEPDRWFSAALGPSFPLGFPRELLEFVCGDRLGAGMSREVFKFRPYNGWVIKFEPMPGKFQNVEEWRTWQEVQDTDHAKWFAPCMQISDCGRILIQLYADPIKTRHLPVDVPTYLTDLKPSNWGTINGQPVCVDYGRTMLMTKGLSSRMVKAKWR